MVEAFPSFIDQGCVNMCCHSGNQYELKVLPKLSSFWEIVKNEIELDI